MPLKKCKKNGKDGWSWGNGPCLIGPDSKKRAIKMAIKIEGPDKFKKIMDSEGCTEDDKATYAQVISEAQVAEASTGNRFADAVADHLANKEAESTFAYVSQETRDKMKHEDFGWPEEKKYPVGDESHFKSAVKLLGRAPQHMQERIKERLKKIAKRRGYSLPTSWE